MSLLGNPTDGWFAQFAHGVDWLKNNTIGRIPLIGSGLGKDGTEIVATAVGHWTGNSYLPPVYERTQATISRGLPANATPEQIAQASADAHIANVQAQQATANYQNAAVDIATLPMFYLGGGSTAFAGRSLLIRLPARFAINTAALAAVDLPTREGASLAFNAVSPGVRPSESLGSALVNLASPGTLQPNAVQQAHNAAHNAVDNAKIIEKIRMLTGNDRNELTFADLDRDGDGILTARDVTMIREKLGNDRWTDAVFTILREQGITFNNQAVSELGATLGVSGSSNDSGVQNLNSNEAGFFSKIWSVIVGGFNSVVKFFGDLFRDSSKPPQTTASAGSIPAQPVVNPTESVPSVPQLPFTNQPSVSIQQNQR